MSQRNCGILTSEGFLAPYSTAPTKRLIGIRHWWYITFLSKQWCKALNKGHGISEKREPEAIASLSFPNIHP